MNPKPVDVSLNLLGFRLNVVKDLHRIGNHCVTPGVDHSRSRCMNYEYTAKHIPPPIVCSDCRIVTAKRTSTNFSSPSPPPSPVPSPT